MDVPFLKPDCRSWQQQPSAYAARALQVTSSPPAVQPLCAVPARYFHSNIDACSLGCSYMQTLPSKAVLCHAPAACSTMLLQSRLFAIIHVPSECYYNTIKAKPYFTGAFLQFVPISLVQTLYVSGVHCCASAVTLYIADTADTLGTCPILTPTAFTPVFCLQLSSSCTILSHSNSHS